MRYDITDLFAVYANYHEIDLNEVQEGYNEGEISKFDLLDAYLKDEGIYGYSSSIWSIFEALSN